MRRSIRALLVFWCLPWAAGAAGGINVPVPSMPVEPGQPAREKVANVIFATIVDRRGRNILSVRDQNTFDTALRKKRLMTLSLDTAPPLGIMKV